MGTFGGNSGVDIFGFVLFLENKHAVTDSMNYYQNKAFESHFASDCHSFC